MDQAETCADRRSRTLDHLASAISEVRRPEHVVLVAVDGVDGAGKTVFANELAEVLKRRRIVVLRASVDGFHHPPSIRYQRGRRSPEGFFLDSYDYGAVRRLLLEPLAGSGERRVVRRLYDVKTEEPVEAVRESVGDVEVLLFDGIFLHRPELRDLWDLSAFLEVDFEVSIPRGAGRGYGDPVPTSPANRRYVEGQRLYLATCRPRERATWVIDNNVLADAHLTDASRN
jgi:uridine kinase